MSTVKKGILTPAPEWAKHLRPYGKRQFWKGERKAAQRWVDREKNDWPRFRKTFQHDPRFR